MSWRHWHSHAQVVGGRRRVLAHCEAEHVLHARQDVSKLGLHDRVTAAAGGALARTLMPSSDAARCASPSGDSFLPMLR